MRLSVDAKGTLERIVTPVTFQKVSVPEKMVVVTR